MINRCKANPCCGDQTFCSGHPEPQDRSSPYSKSAEPLSAEVDAWDKYMGECAATDQDSRNDVDCVPPEVAQQISEIQPIIDAADAFIAAVIKAEGDDWYRENDEGGLLLCHESGAYFDVFAAMMSVIPPSSVERAGYSDADALRDLQESILQSTSIADFMAVKKTVEAIRQSEAGSGKIAAEIEKRGVADA